MSHGPGPAPTHAKNGLQSALKRHKPQEKRDKDTIETEQRKPDENTEEPKTSLKSKSAENRQSYGGNTHTKRRATHRSSGN
jgi:hypothetical protein